MSNDPNSILAPAAEPTETSIERSYTTAQVSFKTGIAVETLRVWRRRNQGPSTFKVGRRWYYPDADLAQWITEQRSGPNAQTAGAPRASGE